MKIYLIKLPPNKWGYDWYDAHVVVANSEKEVRELVKVDAGNEGTAIWDDNLTAVTEEGQYAGKQKTPFILLSSYIGG